MSNDDREYFRQRASEERARAEAATSAKAASVHRALAAKYESLADKADQPPGLSLVWDQESRKQASS